VSCLGNDKLFILNKLRLTDDLLGRSLSMKRVVTDSLISSRFQPAKRLNTRQPGCSGEFTCFFSCTFRNRSDSQIDHERLIDASKHMYDILTANYSALFRDSSPLHLDWRIGSNFEYIGKSPILKAAFYELRNEVFRFCRYSLSYDGSVSLTVAR
jgi:hypothetical protein